MSMILGNSNLTPSGVSGKSTQSKGDVNKALNFGNISKAVSFNDGGMEGYYKVRPKALKPSPHNPRPDWGIDDRWLVTHVGIDMDDIFESTNSSECLVQIQEEELDGKHIEHVTFPEFNDLKNNPNPLQQKEYEFLVRLAKNIREIGQIQPIEIESNPEGNALVVLEGHLRRLACILGRVPYINAIRNEGLQGLSQREKIGRQITENSLRSNLTPYGNYQLAIDEVKENTNITVRELRDRLKIKREFASALLKVIGHPEKFHPLILETLKTGDLTVTNFIKVTAISSLDRQENFISKLLKKEKLEVKSDIKTRGTDGRRKSVATMQIKSHEQCLKAGNKLLDLLPQLKEISNIHIVESVDDLSSLLKSFEKLLLDIN